MKKHIKTITIAAILIAAYSILKKDPLENVSFTDNLKDVVVPVVATTNQSHTVNFELCNPSEDFKILSNTGTTSLKLIEKNQTECLVETIFESAGGSYTNECKIPLSMGTVKFEGEDFEQISHYCEIKSTGTGLLELN